MHGPLTPAVQSGRGGCIAAMKSVDDLTWSTWPFPFWSYFNSQKVRIRTEPVERGDTRFFTSATSDGIEN